ncbi:MAG: beta-glucosidase [Caulobacteraceae bacterium]
MKSRILGGAAVLALACAAPTAQAQPHRWSDPSLTPDQSADLALGQMTQDEKIALVHGNFPRVMKPGPPPGAPSSAGFIAGIPRLDLPDLRESDASLGVATAGRKDDDAAALPSSMLMASTWSPEAAYAGGAMIGKETRQKGFNVLLNGGVNLTRDPFNGRNFEYLGEDPLLAGTLAGAAIAGIQSQHVVSTAKHYLMNDQETGRGTYDARIGEAAMRESDLLAFEIAIQKGQPGSVMCAYNRINGAYACENPHTLTDVLKTDWGWKGWVMSDWGAVHSVDAAAAGLDQESGQELDRQVFFDAPLREALAAGKLTQARLDDMVRRILRSEFAFGLVGPQVPAGALDVQADARVAQAESEAGIVLLKNDGGVLPLAASARRIAVIGGHADIGVLSGGGSSQVVPRGSTVLPRPAGAPEWVEGTVYHPSAPLQAIKARAKGETTFQSGADLAAAVAAAKAADVAVVFVEQWASEAIDVPIRLSPDQETLIEAVAAANPRTVVVLENGGPLLMPWIGKVQGVVEAWYPGMRGGEAIARILFGEVNPAGRLPATFAADPGQLPRAIPVGADRPQPAGAAPGAEPAFPVEYREGSSVGYRWFAQTGAKPLFPFGFGLSYTTFRYGALKLSGGKALSASVAVTNTGRREGVETVQLYLSKGPARSQRRLLGWAQVKLRPGETRTVALTAEPKLLANWDDESHGWAVAPGRYEVFAGPDAETAAQSGAVELQAAHLAP